MTSLHIDLGRDWRGGQSQALLLLQGLRERGQQAELVAMEGSPLAERAREAGIKVHAVGHRARRAQAALRLRSLFGEKRVDVVHAHDAHGLTAAWFARAHRHAALVASRRVMFPLQSNRLALARYRAADRVLAISRFVAEQVINAGINNGRVTVVYDGVDIHALPTPEERRRERSRWRVTEDMPLLGCVGYMEPGKGHSLLLQALPILRAQFPSLRLLLRGEGPCRASLEKQTRDLGFSAAVDFPSVDDNLPNFYAALDLFIFPSVAEGLGSALLMAMAAGLPTVAFAQGANPEVIEDGRNGLLAANADPESLASTVSRLLAGPERARRLGSAARQTIEERFTVDHMVEGTLCVYEEVRRKIPVKETN